jgi:hypothetical protein
LIEPNRTESAAQDNAALQIMAEQREADSSSRFLDPPADILGSAQK